jgi:hypothetical protein
LPSSTKKKRSKGRNSAKFERAKNRVLAANQICQFRGNDRWPPCGQIIDLDLKWPHPMSGTANHIIPVSRLAWDDPLTYDVNNLEPMHLVCNQRLGDGSQKKQKHPTSRDWRE